MNTIEINNEKYADDKLIQLELKLNKFCDDCINFIPGINVNSLIEQLKSMAIDIFLNFDNPELIISDIEIIGGIKIVKYFTEIKYCEEVLKELEKLGISS